jgi:hypothetical protein
VSRSFLMGLLMLATVVSAQRRVDPTNMYHRVICVVPYVGQGTESDPRRPMYAPKPGDQPSASGFIGYMQVASDDGKFALVVFVARDRAAFATILANAQIPAFVNGETDSADIETALRKYKKNFTLDQLKVVVP